VHSLEIIYIAFVIIRKAGEDQFQGLRREVEFEFKNIFVKRLKEKVVKK
jgi:hypothetical protein